MCNLIPTLKYSFMPVSEYRLIIMINARFDFNQSRWFSIVKLGNVNYNYQFVVWYEHKKDSKSTKITNNCRLPFLRITFKITKIIFYTIKVWTKKNIAHTKFDKKIEEKIKNSLYFSSYSCHLRLSAEIL